MHDVADLALDLADFISASPTPYHAVAEAAARLTAAGFTEQVETAEWDTTPGGRYLVRDGTVLAWWQRGDVSPLRIFAAHTDSPTLKVKPLPDTGAGGWRQVAVEVYGGALWNSWLDRDLGLAGRLSLYDGTSVLVDVARPLLRVPQLAIHLDRSVNQGLTLDAQQHLLPIWGLGSYAEGDLLAFLAAETDVDAGEIAAHDLVVHDLTPPARLGEHGELLAAPRLDNLSSVHAGITSLIAAAERDPSATPALHGLHHAAIGSATRHPRRPPQLPAPARARPPRPAQPGPVAQGQRQPALRHRRPRRRRVAARLPDRGRRIAVLRREEHRALRLDGRPDHRDAARHPDRRRRHPRAVDALRPRAVRRRRPRASRRRLDRIPHRRDLSGIRTRRRIPG